MDSPMEVICSKYNGDTLCEILMKVDPSNIFKCMLVSKQWLSAITDPVFRKNYLNRWRNSNSKVVGLLLYDHIGMKSRRRPGIQLLPTSNLGLKLNSTLSRGIAFFISKSPKGGLLLLGGIDPKRFFVCRPIFGGPPVELPPPPAHYKSCMANILSDDDDGEAFKVILAWNWGVGDDTRVRIQTYCSRSGEWGEQSSLSCSTPFRVSPSSASMAQGSVIYWAALINNKVRCLAAWDMNGGRRISLIPEPVPSKKNNSGFSFTYGVSSQPQYSLLAATCSFHIRGTIHIWALDDDGKDWHLLYSVRHASIWTNNYSSLLKPLYEERPEHGFTIVSFVPGKSASLFLEMDGHLFVYSFHTNKLELVEYWKQAFVFLSLFVANHGRLMHCHPLTLLDLGIWPSSPPALQLPPSY